MYLTVYHLYCAPLLPLVFTFLAQTMAVLHYISVMHELGYTRRKVIVPQAIPQADDPDDFREGRCKAPPVPYGRDDPDNLDDPDDYRRTRGRSHTENDIQDILETNRTTFGSPDVLADSRKLLIRTFSGLGLPADRNKRSEGPVGIISGPTPAVSGGGPSDEAFFSAYGETKEGISATEEVKTSLIIVKDIKMS